MLWNGITPTYRDIPADQRHIYPLIWAPVAPQITLKI